METLSIITSLINIIKNLFFWILKLFKRKIVHSDTYEEEVLTVRSDYPTISERCKEETNKGATFYWSNICEEGYEKYFEIVNHTRRSFQLSNSHILWIKRPKNN